jgi:hypothetical protein
MIVWVVGTDDHLASATSAYTVNKVYAFKLPGGTPTPTPTPTAHQPNGDSDSATTDTYANCNSDSDSTDTYGNCGNTDSNTYPTPGPTAACQRPLTIDHTKVPSTQSNFTVLVSLTDPALKTVANGGHVANANGYDIGFYADSGGTTKLKWEVEKYDGTTGNLIAWVKIPSVSSSTDTVFYLMYGDSSINTNQSDPPNTWDSNFKGVWHMADSAANTTIRESTVTGANGTNNANTSSKTATGQIGNALSYNGSTDGSFAAINLSATNIATLSFWMKWTTNANDDHLAFEYTPNYNTNAGGFIADWNSSSFGGGKFETGMGKGGTYWTDLFTRPSAVTWHLVHLVFNRSGPTNKVYVDGSLQTLTTGTRSASGMGNFSNSSLYFMSRAASALNAAGTLDEVRLSTMERNASWTHNGVQQPKLAGNIYHHGQRELRYGEVHAHHGPNGSGQKHAGEGAGRASRLPGDAGKILMDGENLWNSSRTNARDAAVPGFPVSERNSGRDHRQFSARRVAIASARRRRTRGDRLLRQALRKDGTARHGSFVHFALGQ